MQKKSCYLIICCSICWQNTQSESNNPVELAPVEKNPTPQEQTLTKKAEENCSPECTGICKGPYDEPGTPLQSTEGFCKAHGKRFSDTLSHINLTLDIGIKVPEVFAALAKSQTPTINNPQYWQLNNNELYTLCSIIAYDLAYLRTNHQMFSYPSLISEWQKRLDEHFQTTYELMSHLKQLTDLQSYDPCKLYLQTKPNLAQEADDGMETDSDWPDSDSSSSTKHSLIETGENLR